MDGVPDKDDSMPLKKGELKPFGTVEYENEIKGKTETLVLPNPSTVKYDLPIEYYNVNDVISLRKYAIQFGKEKAISKAAINIMMEDVNKCEDYLQYISDEDWTKFCKFFCENVQKYGNIDEELHYFRNKINRAPDTIYKLLIESKKAETDDDKWVLFDYEHTLYHMFDTYMSPDGVFNLKFVSSKNSGNMFEAVYNYDGVLLTAENDPVNCGTFNYCSDQIDKQLHKILDVNPYKDYGNVKGYPYPGKDETDEIIKNYKKNTLAKEHRAYYESQNAFEPE